MEEAGTRLVLRLFLSYLCPVKIVYFLALFFLHFIAMGEAQTTLPNFNKFWDYSDPAGTRIKFTDLIPLASASEDTSYYLQLLTQIARTFSLEGNFDDAHKMLD